MKRQDLRPAAVLVVALALLAVYAGHWSRVDGGQIGGSDFSATYVGGSLWRDGHRADLYSSGLQSALHAKLNPPDSSGDLPFVNPPVAAVLAAPLSLTGIDLAYRLWVACQFAMLLIAVVIAARFAPWRPDTTRLTKLTTAVAGLAGVATLQFVMVGQWDGVPALGLAGAYALWRRGRIAGGAALLAATSAVAKPHLALGLAAFLVGWRDRRAIAGAAAGALGVVAACALAVGTAGFSGFVSADLVDATAWPLRSLLGFTGLFGSWLGDSGVAHVLAAIGTAGAAAACLALGAAYRRHPDLLEIALGGAVALSLVASPHLLLHDLVLLAPVLVWTVAAVPRRAAIVACLWALINVAASVDLGNSLPAPPGRLVPWALLLIGAVAAVEIRRRRPGSIPLTGRGTAPVAVPG